MKFVYIALELPDLEDLALPVAASGTPISRDGAPLIRWTEAKMQIEMLVGALRPLTILQIGSGERLFYGANEGVVVVTKGSLAEALATISPGAFDAIILGRGLRDAWSSTAYERVAEVAGSTPIVALTESVEQLTTLKAQRERVHDVVVTAAASSSVLEQLALAATIRRRALAANPQLKIG